MLCCENTASAGSASGVSWEGGPGRRSRSGSRESPGSRPGRGYYLESRYHFTPNTPQGASALDEEAWASQTVAANRKELAYEKLNFPHIFKEAYSSKCSAEIRREGGVVIVQLKHPAPGEISIFEFAIEDSGTIARSGRLLSPTKEPSDFWFSKESRMTVARIKALEWCYSQARLRDLAIGRPQVNRRPEPTNPAQVSASKPKTEEVPRKSTPEVRPPSQPRQATAHKPGKHTKEKQRSKASIIGGQVHSLIPHCRDGLTRLRKSKASHPSAKHIWKGELLHEGFLENEVNVLMSSKTPESAACRFVAQKHPEMELKTVQNHYSAFKHS